MEKATFEQVSSFLLSQMTMVTLYKEQPVMEKVLEQLNDIYIPLEEWKKLTIPEARLIGFKQWEEENNLMLIPGYLHQFIPKELELYSISGKKVQLSETDTECRFGCLAYGIYMENHT